MDKFLNYWKTVPESMYYLGGNQSARFNILDEIWFSTVGLEDAVVVDYGCGGAIFAKHLFENYNISKYIGIDISDRALALAKDNLSEYDGKFELIKPQPDLSKFDARILISYATMRYFDKAMADEFFNSVNNSGIPFLFLNYKPADKTTWFNPKLEEKPFANAAIMMYANAMDPSYIALRLSNYTMIQYSDDGHMQLINTEYLESMEEESREEEIPAIEVPTFEIEVNEPVDKIETEFTIEEEPVQFADVTEPVLIPAGETKTGKTLYWYNNGSKIIKVTEETAEKKGYIPATEDEI